MVVLQEKLGGFFFWGMNNKPHLPQGLKGWLSVLQQQDNTNKQVLMLLGHLESNKGQRCLILFQQITGDGIFLSSPLKLYHAEAPVFLRVTRTPYHKH